eukprot:GHVP01067406.1.p1 GENE.GHVP01067406.1~~GHVP01067406.1.p1  ORF type:complete len:171 (+),score=44.99 GHVP01067406.1:630-1142(+)
MEFLEELSKLKKPEPADYIPTAPPLFDGEILPSETAISDISISFEEDQGIYNPFFTKFFGNSGPLSLGWKHFRPNLPYNPEIFKGSLDSPPLILRSPVDEEKWFAAFPVQNPGQAGKIYGLLDEVGGKLIPTKLYLTLEDNENKFYVGEKEFTLGLTDREIEVVICYLKK